jgi:hypothetical protein
MRRTIRTTLTYGFLIVAVGIMLTDFYRLLQV